MRFVLVSNDLLETRERFAAFHEPYDKMSAKIYSEYKREAVLIDI